MVGSIEYLFVYPNISIDSDQLMESLSLSDLSSKRYLCFFERATFRWPFLFVLCLIMDVKFEVLEWDKLTRDQLHACIKLR